MIRIILLMLGVALYAILPLIIGNAVLPDWSINCAYYILIVLMLYALAVAALASPKRGSS